LIKDIPEFVEKFDIEIARTRNLDSPDERSFFHGLDEDPNSVSFSLLKDEWIVGFVITAMFNEIFVSDIVYHEMSRDVMVCIRDQLIDPTREKNCESDLRVHSNDPFKFVQQVTRCSDEALEDLDLLRPEWISRYI
jgi:hypothetical protein